jgi:hypothetical protein
MVGEGPDFVAQASAMDDHSIFSKPDTVIPILGLSVSNDSSLHHKTRSKSATCGNDGQLAR